MYLWAKRIAETAVTWFIVTNAIVTAWDHIDSVI
jgi:hypothetical protein